MTRKDYFLKAVGCGRKIRTGKVLENITRSHFEPRFLKRFPEANLDELDPSLFVLEFPCCTIMNADCVDYLWLFDPQTFDLVITDPPYGLDINGWQEHHAPVRWDARFPAENVHFITDILKLARLGYYYFCPWQVLWDSERRKGMPGAQQIDLPQPENVLIWHKLGGAGIGDCDHTHWADHEMVLFYPGPEHEFKDNKRPRSVLPYGLEGNDIHPTQKPVELIEEMLDWYECETVLDPYMGSGTTAVAALKSDRHFLGFEANEEYWKEANERIADFRKP
jgi:DNA methylase